MSVIVKNYDAPQIDFDEICRYMRGGEESRKIAQQCIDECDGRLRYSVCYDVFAAEVTENKIRFPFAVIESERLSKHLSGCEKIVLFAATVGIELDRLIARYSRISPVKALAFQAIGAERTEALCDLFCNELKERYGEAFVRSRFSPGYGDLSIEVQRDIFRVLDCPKKIGLSLNESLIMSPSKSVTAIVGISKNEGECKKIGCGSCDKSDCEYRKRKAEE